MKYEAVFGDYKFSSPACEIAMQSSFGEIIEMGFTKPLVITEGWGVIAMRRIIAEPKRWTVEDKKAGRLPEVGSEVILRITGEIATVNAANKNMVCLTFSYGGFSPFNVERIDPIETPDEKAQREEDEFVGSLRSVEIHDGTVGGFFNQGARAAYRKMKGGE